MSEPVDSMPHFDPNGTGLKGKLFGLPYSLAQAELVVVPLPWEVTVSGSTGTAKGPQEVIRASSEIDLFSKEIETVWKLKIASLELSREIQKHSDKLRNLAAIHIHAIEHGVEDESSKIITQKINEGCETLNVYVHQITRDLLTEEKMVGLLGGDHSTPLGLLRALHEKYSTFGILQFDAHADLRKSYQGFTYSHACIMYHALKLRNVTRLVQVGVRDFCEQEYQLIEQSKGRVVTFFDSDLKNQLFDGKSWSALCSQLIAELPDLVYISFDIDALTPAFCPHTGTPVPGGLSYDQAVYLIKQVVLSGRRIIAFDVSEVSGQSPWDAQVGSRILFGLCTWMAVSQGKLNLTSKKRY